MGIFLVFKPKTHFHDFNAVSYTANVLHEHQPNVVVNLLYGSLALRCTVIAMSM